MSSPPTGAFPHDPGGPRYRPGDVVLYDGRVWTVVETRAYVDHMKFAWAFSYDLRRSVKGVGTSADPWADWEQEGRVEESAIVPFTPDGIEEWLNE